MEHCSLRMWVSTILGTGVVMISTDLGFSRSTHCKSTVSYVLHIASQQWVMFYTLQVNSELCFTHCKSSVSYVWHMQVNSELCFTHCKSTVSYGSQIASQQWVMFYILLVNSELCFTYCKSTMCYVLHVTCQQWVMFFTLQVNNELQYVKYQ